MLSKGDKVRCTDYCMNLLHGEGVVYEVWGESMIQKFYEEVGGKKPKKEKVWYRVLFDEEYQPETDEYDENGELLSLGTDNLITFGEDDLEKAET